MKKNVVKKGLKLQLHRETLRTLEQPQLLDIGAGNQITTPLTACRGCTFRCTI